MLENLDLQLMVTTTVIGYLLAVWAKLAYRMHNKQRERPGLLELNWSLPVHEGKDRKKTEEDYPVRMNPSSGDMEE